MKDYKLNTNDYNNINNLIRLSEELCLNYQNLYKLEITNKKEINEYNENIKKLLVLKNKEDKLYNLDFNIYQEYLLFIIDNFFNKLNNNIINNITALNYDSLPIQRVIINLFNKIIENKNIINELDSEDIDIINRLNEEMNINNLINNSIKIQRSIKDDILTTFIYILEEEINKKKNLYLKDKLIKVKYYTAFINKNIEKELLKNNFKISELYLTSKLVSDMYKIDEELYYGLLKKYSFDIVIEEIKELLKLRSLDFLDDNTNVTAIVRGIFIRSGLINLDDIEVLALNEMFHDLIEKKEYLIFHSEDHISEDIIISSFKNVKRDREKPKKLSLKK